MKDQFIRWLVKLYPPRWRAEYGAELAELLRKGPLGWREACNVLWSGCNERAREPVARFVWCWLLASAATFLISLLLGRRLWVLMATPVAAVLREQGARPASLIQATPLESLAVVWVGLPLVVTGIAAFVLGVLLAWMFFAHRLQRELRRWANEFVVCSELVFVLTFGWSLLAWRGGSFGGLLAMFPDAQNAPLSSVGHCFFLFAFSTLGAACLAEVPVLAIFGWRFWGLRLGRCAVGG